MKDYQVMSEADDTLHIKHKSGKSFTVNKSELSPKAQALIKKMSSGGKVQHFDDGGTVTDSLNKDVAEAQAAARQQIADDAKDSSAMPTSPDPGQYINDQPTPAAVSGASPAGGAEASWAPAAGSQPSPASVGSPVVAAAPTTAATPAAADPYAQLINNQGQRLDQKSTDLNQYAKQADQGYGQQAQAGKDLQTGLAGLENPQEIFKRHQAADQALQDKVMNKQVDPDRYMHNMSTGSKILSAIALAISGAGAGRNGTNLAADHLQKAIGADIDAQKSDQSNTMNLWKMNRDNTKDEMEANLATRNQLLTIAQSKAQMAGNQIQSAQGRLQIQKLVQDIQTEKDKNNLIRSQMTPGANGQPGKMDPLSLVQYMVPAEHQKQAITELGQAQSATENEDNIKQLFDQAAKDTRPASGRSSTSLMNTIPGYAPPSIKALNLLYDPLIHNNEGRINELEQQHVQANSPQFGDSDETVGKKWNAIKQFIEAKKAAPTAKAFGINAQNFASTATPDRSEIQLRGGVPWKKVPGGWLKVNQ